MPTPPMIKRVGADRKPTEEEIRQAQEEQAKKSEAIVAAFTKRLMVPDDEVIDESEDASEKNVSGGELLTIEQVQEQLDKLDVTLIVNEVFDWITRNVAEFIDTRKDEFHLQFEADDQMPEARKLQDLWQAATSKDTVELTDEQLAALDKDASLADLMEDPAVTREAAKFELLEGYCDRILAAMEEDEEGRDKVFAAISHYYKLSGMLRDQETGEVTPVEREVSGYMSVCYFCFENYDLDVAVTPLEPVVDPETKEVTGYARRSDLTAHVESNAAFCVDILVIVRDTEDTGFSLF